MRKKNLLSASPMRVALYIRVSGEEQKIHGLSLEAQQERLEKYAKENGWLIIGTYVDAAKTARKRMHKRTRFMEMLEDVKQDKIDIILFCRLDRWFRNVSDYYKIQEVLESHGCGWKTIDEEYDTTTANGRLYINVKLSIAQNESDICGERIDVVFDSKVSHGTVVSGSCPFGYSVNSEKRLDISPAEAAIVQDAFSHYESTITLRGTIRYIRETFGVNWCYATFSRMLKEELYIGIYNRGGRYNPDFCPAIIKKEQFDHVQELLKRNARYASSGNIYIFTSLLVCDECKHKLIGYNSKEYIYYRCTQHLHRGRCTHNHSIRESFIEKWLFEHLEEEIQKCKLDWDVKKLEMRRSVSSTDKATLKRKLSKLKELYVNDLIDLEEYKKDYDIYSAALCQLPDMPVERPPDFTASEIFLHSDFRNIYNSLTREEKRTLWRSVIKEIHVNNDLIVTGIIFG